MRMFLPVGAIAASWEADDPAPPSVDEPAVPPTPVVPAAPVVPVFTGWAALPHALDARIRPPSRTTRRLLRIPLIQTNLPNSLGDTATKARRTVALVV